MRISDGEVNLVRYLRPESMNPKIGITFFFDINYHTKKVKFTFAVHDSLTDNFDKASGRSLVKDRFEEGKLVFEFYMENDSISEYGTVYDAHNLCLNNYFYENINGSGAYLYLPYLVSEEAFYIKSKRQSKNKGDFDFFIVSESFLEKFDFANRTDNYYVDEFPKEEVYVVDAGYYKAILDHKKRNV